MLTHGSLFSGIGGFDLGFERAGIQTIWQVENDPYCLKVLEKHWPYVKRYQDIREIRWEDVEVPDIVSGGFPCQPVSTAGKRLGQADERWLWPEFARCLRVLRPRYVVVENVPGILVRGFGDVLGDLAALGYDAEWDCIPAAAFGAPHLRYRVWIVAYAPGDESRRINRGLGEAPKKESGRGNKFAEKFRCRSQKADVADANGSGRQGRAGRPTGRRVELENGGNISDAAIRRNGKIPQPNKRTVSGCYGEALPRSNWWAVEPDVGRVAYGISARVDRLKGLGNAVVPQIANWLAERILEFET